MRIKKKVKEMMNLTCLDAFIDRKKEKERPKDAIYEDRLRDVLANGDRRKLRALFIEYGMRDAETAPRRAMEITFNKMRMKMIESVGMTQ